MGIYVGSKTVWNAVELRLYEKVILAIEKYQLENMGTEIMSNS
jgi:hypothetical protein